MLAAETTGVVVINNNHDFYWEGGKAGCKRNPGEQPGLATTSSATTTTRSSSASSSGSIPWNGRRWAQVNINSLQSRRLIDRLHFHPDGVFTLGTGLDELFFRERSRT